MHNTEIRTGPGPARWLSAMLWLAAAVCATAGLETPLYIGNVVPVTDQYGRPMRGSPLAIEAAGRYRVELRVAKDGIIHHPRWINLEKDNPLLTTNGVNGLVGMGLNAAQADSGMFCVVYPLRPTPGTQVYARVFNAPTLAEATFYANTDLRAVPTLDESLVLSFEKARPMDPGDDDLDGLNNSWEQVLGTYDRLTPDYENDGMPDLNEMLAGTDPTRAQSKLAFQLVRRDTAPAPLGEGGAMIKPVRVKWQSVPGKRYQLEFVPTLLGAPVFLPVGDIVTADEGETEIEMLVDVEDADAGTFRVRLVQEQE
mgnify:CR=1 FL=1